MGWEGKAWDGMEWNGPDLGSVLPSNAIKVPRVSLSSLPFSWKETWNLVSWKGKRTGSSSLQQEDIHETDGEDVDPGYCTSNRSKGLYVRHPDSSRRSQSKVGR